jgi:hypothetical protein
VHFEPFLALKGGKTLKNRLNNPFGHILGTYEQLFAVFCDVSVIFGDFFTL